MPREARIVLPEYVYHITQRGNYKQTTFEDNADYEKYLKWMEEYSNKYDMSILAYCLMPNHVHFIAVPHKKESLAKTYNTCHMRYSQYYNRKKKQRGHLWQGRFYSCILGKSHLYAAIRYVENNPVRAKFVKRPEQWKYSSAGYHLGVSETLLSVASLEQYIEIEDWKEYLSGEPEEGTINAIRANTKTGRPSGNDSFIRKMEELLGRRLRALPHGRPRNKK